MKKGTELTETTTYFNWKRIGWKEEYESRPQRKDTSMPANGQSLKQVNFELARIGYYHKTESECKKI